jgi:hypothetical protein
MPDWLTPDGVDLGRIPLGPIVRRILDEDERTFWLNLHGAGGDVGLR